MGMIPHQSTIASLLPRRWLKWNARITLDPVRFSIRSIFPRCPTVRCRREKMSNVDERSSKIWSMSSSSQFPSPSFLSPSPIGLLRTVVNPPNSLWTWTFLRGNFLAPPMLKEIAGDFVTATESPSRQGTKRFSTEIVEELIQRANSRSNERMFSFQLRSTTERQGRWMRKGWRKVQRLHRSFVHLFSSLNGKCSSQLTRAKTFWKKKIEYSLTLTFLREGNLRDSFRRSIGSSLRSRWGNDMSVSSFDSFRFLFLFRRWTALSRTTEWNSIRRRILFLDQFGHGDRTFHLDIFVSQRISWCSTTRSRLSERFVAWIQHVDDENELWHPNGDFPLSSLHRSAQLRRRSPSVWTSSNILKIIHRWSWTRSPIHIDMLILRLRPPVLLSIQWMMIVHRRACPIDDVEMTQRSPGSWNIKKMSFNDETDKIIDVFWSHRWKRNISSKLSMNLVKNQNHGMILMKCSLFIDEIKIHQCFCPFHHTTCHFFGVFRIKNIMFDDVSVPWEGRWGNASGSEDRGSNSRHPSEAFFLMSMDYLRILRSKSCPMDTFEVKSCGTLAHSSTWDSWPHDLSSMQHALDSHSSACNLSTCSWERTLFEHFLWMDCCRRRYCQSATSSHQGGMMHRFERSVWLVINKVAIWTAERENEASFVRGRRYPFCR